MAISLPPDLVEDLYRHSSVAGVVVEVPNEQGHALREALRHVERRVFDEIPYPEDPGQGPLATGAEFSVRTDGYGLTFDMPDAAAYRSDPTPVHVTADTIGAPDTYGIDQPMERLVAILIEELREQGLDDCTVARYPVHPG
jgi:hypothetical protein